MNIFFKPLNLSNMNMNSTTEKLVNVFSQDELSSLMTAVAGYVNVKRKQGRSTGVEVVLFNKVCDALLASNYLNAVEVETIARKNPYSKDVPKEYWGTASGKALLAEMEEGSTNAYSY